jgi:hypothetical protein
VKGAKRNKSATKIGKRRGFPVRAAIAIARKYSLTHIVVYARDVEGRSRITYNGKSDLAAMQSAYFAKELAKKLGWDVIGDRDCLSVRRLKNRIKELELACAEIVDCAPGSDPVAIARAAGKFPDES